MSKKVARSELDVIIYVITIYVTRLHNGKTTNSKYNIRALYKYLAEKRRIPVDSDDALFLVPPEEVDVILPPIDLASVLDIASAVAGDGATLTSKEVLLSLFRNGEQWPSPLDISATEEVNGLMLAKLRDYITGAWFHPEGVKDMAGYLLLVREAVEQCVIIEDDKHIHYERYLKVLAACESYTPPEFDETPTAWKAPFTQLVEAVVDLNWYRMVEEGPTPDASTRMRAAAIRLIIAVIVNGKSNERLAFYYMLEAERELIEKIVRDPLGLSTMEALLPSHEMVEVVVDAAWKHRISADDFLRVHQDSALRAAVPERVLLAVEASARAKPGGAIYLPDLLPDAVKRVVGIRTPFTAEEVPTFLRLCDLSWKLLYEEEARREAAGIRKSITLQDLKKAGGAPAPPQPPPLPPRQPPVEATPRARVVQEVREYGRPMKDADILEVAERDIGPTVIMNTKLLTEQLAKRRGSLMGSDEEEEDEWLDEEDTQLDTQGQKEVADRVMYEEAIKDQFAPERLTEISEPNFDVSTPAVGMVSTRAPVFGAINFTESPVKSSDIGTFRRGLKFSSELRTRISDLRRLGPYTPRKVLANGELEDAEAWYRRNRKGHRESYVDFVKRNTALLTPSMSAKEVHTILTNNTEILGRLLAEGFSREPENWDDAWRYVSREFTIAKALEFSKFLFLLGALSRVPSVRSHLERYGDAFYHHSAHWETIEKHIAAMPKPEPECAQPEVEPTSEPEPEPETDPEPEPEPALVGGVPEGHYHGDLAEPYKYEEPIGARMDAFIWEKMDSVQERASRAMKVLNQKAAELREFVHQHSNVVQVSGSSYTQRFDALVRKHYGDAPFRPGQNRTLLRLPNTQMELLNVERRSDVDQKGFVRQFMVELQEDGGVDTIDGVIVLPKHGGGLHRALASDDAPACVLEHPPITAFAFLGE